MLVYVRGLEGGGGGGGGWKHACSQSVFCSQLACISQGLASEQVTSKRLLWSCYRPVMQNLVPPPPPPKKTPKKTTSKQRTTNKQTKLGGGGCTYFPPRTSMLAQMVLPCYRGTDGLPATSDTLR